MASAHRFVYHEEEIGENDLMAWIDASTDVYWHGPTYAGDGHWIFPYNGGEYLYETDNTPLKTVSGIRIYYSFTKPLYAPNNFQFETNYARVSPLVHYGLASGTTMQEWTFDPDIDERVIKIIVPWGFGDYYASTAIITKIELRTSLSPDAVWKDYQNTRESYIE